MAVVALVSGVFVGAVAAPVAAAPTALVLTMEEGGGTLQIRGQEDSYELESPTTFAATLDTGPGGTGAITGSALSTPSFSFEAPVLGGSLTAEVDVSFAEVAPGTYTGVVSSGGDVTLRTALRVDLHIEVPAAGITGDCATSPVELELISTAPYDTGTQEVTVADANFSIPSFAPSSTCESTLVGPLNDLLAGPGHSLTLDLGGAMELPPEPPDGSVTTLEVAPVDGARFGEEVTLRATVAPGPDAEATDTPTGTVAFAVDGRSIGQVSLIDGVAELTTSTMRVGSRRITASYSGEALYGASSDEVSYVIEAVPALDVDLPPMVVIDADPEELSMVIESSHLGQDIANVAVDVTITRPSGGLFRQGMVRLERRVAGDTWETVPLVNGSTVSSVAGRLGPVTGRPLPAPGAITDDLRISAAPTGDFQTTPRGPVTVRFDVVEVDPDDGATVAPLTRSEGRLLLVDEDRLVSEVYYDDFFGLPVGPTVVRAGNTVGITSWQVIETGFGPAVPTGTVSVAVDGVPVRVWYPALGVDAEPVPAVPLDPTTGLLPIMYYDVPATTLPGPHTVTVTYGGDALFLPSSNSYSFTVVAQRDTLYDCTAPGTTPHRFRAQVSAFARLPAAAPRGGQVTLRNLDVSFVVDRSDKTGTLFEQLVDTTPTPLGTPTSAGGILDAVGLGFGEATGTALSATRTGGTQYDPGDTNPDLQITFDGESASIPVTGAPGSTLPVDLDRIELDGRTIFGGVYDITCVPTDAPIRLGTVTVAGTTLSAEGPSPLRAGHEVTLRAAVAPSTASGQVEFSANGEVIDIAPIIDGQAVGAATLPVGAHELIAHTRSGLTAPSTSSEAVLVTVLPEFDCPAFTDEGNGAVVRLVYLELLGRCPDAAGYAHWVDRLDGGTSREVFARSIARTSEAVGRVVDDAYQAMLGRPADAAGRAFWTGRLQASGRYDQLLADLAASDEFWVLSGSTNQGVVTRIYERLLHRSPDQSGLAFWTGRLNGGTSRRALVLRLANLPEPLGALVDDAYDEILDRQPIVPERREGITFLGSTGDRSGLYAQLIGTPEFNDRAQQLPNPED